MHNDRTLSQRVTSMGGFRRESSTFLKILSLVDELRILLLSVSYFHAVPETQKEQEWVHSVRDWLDNGEPPPGNSLRASEPGTEELV